MDASHLENIQSEILQPKNYSQTPSKQLVTKLCATPTLLTETDISFTHLVPLLDVVKLPTLAQTIPKRNMKRKHSTILTSSPLKDALVQKKTEERYKLTIRTTKYD